MKRLFSAILAITMVVSALSACSTKKKPEESKTEINQTAQTEQQQPNAEPASTASAEEKKDTETKKAPDVKTLNAALYFPDKEAMGVIKEEREVALPQENLDTAQKAKILIEELIKGSNSGLGNSIPSSTKIMSVKLDNGTLTVDLSREFDLDHSGGSAGVLMTMSQLVLTLTELEGVKQVSFKIEGRTVEDFKGAMEFSKPFTRSEYEQYLKK